MTKKLLTGIIFLSLLISNQVSAGDKNKVDLNCYKGKWSITDIKYNRRALVIVREKNTRELAQQLSEYLEGATITFNDKKVTLKLPDDTTIYSGEIEIKVEIVRQQSGGGPNGATFYHSSAIKKLYITFTEEPKYNFDLLYDCPIKNMPKHEALNAKENISYTFVRAKE